MRVISRRLFGRAATGLVSASMFVWAVMATEIATTPNFSGMWGRNFIFFEPPPSGPGPIVSKLMHADGTMNTTSSTVGDYTSPILKPNAAEALKKRGEIELSGAASPDPHNQCWPEPMPFTLGVQFGMEILQQKNEVTLLYIADHKVRHVRMNMRHPAHVAPTWQGDSVGHYEGDTLVIDTVGFKVGPLSRVDLYGTPFTQALHVVERYRLIDGAAARDAQRKHESDYFPTGVSSPLTNEYGRGDLDLDVTKKGLQVEFTVDDPGMFTSRWSGLVTYRPVLGEWPEAVCAENRREYYSNKDTEVPQADEPDF